MESGQIELVKLIAEASTWNEPRCRLFLVRMEGTWTLRTLLVDVVEQPIDSTWSIYDYGRIAFLQQSLKGDDLARWLAGDIGQLAGYTFQLPALSPYIDWQGYSSHMLNTGIYRLSQPHTIYRVQPTDSALRVPGDRDSPLVANNCPAFPDYQTAAYRLLYEVGRQPGQELRSETVVIRIAHNDAWIEHVFLRPRSIGITIQGRYAEGVRLVIGGTEGTIVDKCLEGEGTLNFDLPAGIPPELWILLAREDRCLDRRDLANYEKSSSRPWDNVTLEPGSLCAQIEELIHDGENDKVEFKEIVPEKEDKFLKTVAAFASGNGGVILVGVADSTGEIRGINVDIDKHKDGISNSIRNRIVPQPEVRIEGCEIQGKQIVAVFVEEGTSPPYGLEIGRPTFYVRRNATTFRATQAEIRAMARKGTSRD